MMRVAALLGALQRGGMTAPICQVLPPCRSWCGSHQRMQVLTNDCYQAPEHRVRTAPICQVLPPCRSWCGSHQRMQVLTNDCYQAPEHRVRVSGREPRQSTAFFLNPAYSADIAPLAACTKGPPAYR